MRKNLVPMGTLVIVLLLHANKTISQRLQSPLSINEPQLRSLVSDRLSIPDLKSAFFSYSSIRLFSQTGNANAGVQGPTFQYSSAAADISVWNIPFSFNYTSSNGWRDLQPLNFGVTQFNKEKYLQQLGERLKKTVNPEELFSQYLNSLYAKRDEAIQKIRKDISAILPAGNQEWTQGVLDKINSDNIAHLGMDQLMQTLVAKAKANVIEKETQLIQSKAAAQSRSADSIATAERELSALYQSQKHVEEGLASLQKKWLDAGIMETIGSFEKRKRALIDKLLQDPEAIAKTASQHLKLHGLRKLMLFAKQASIGASGVNQGNLQLKDVLLNGINASFLKGNRYLAPVLGSQPGLKNIAEAGYANFNQLPDIFTAALRMGKGDPQKDFSHVSVALFQQNNNMQLLQNALSRSLPKNFVATFSKRMSFGENHYVLAEVSKSTMLYNGASAEKGNGIKDIVNSNNLMENLGIAVDYGSEFDGIGLTNKLTLRRTGKAYENLGNSFLAGGVTEISNDLKKNFLNRRLVLHTRVNYRQYEFSVNDRKLKSFSFMGDVKWKFKKGEFIEARYQPYFNRSNAQENSLQSKSYRIALRANISRKISRGFSYRNFIELSSSKDDFYDAVFGNNSTTRFISFTSLQTVTIGRRSFFVNITANHAKQNTGFIFGNSSLAADAGMQFTAGERIMLSSGLIYNQVSELYTQFAIRQSLSAMLGKKLTVEGYLQAGPKLYEAPGLDIPLTTGNLSISYNLK